MTKLDALAPYWAPISAQPAVYPRATQVYVDRFVQSGQYDDIPPPTRSLLGRVLRRLAPSCSAPGVDGLPYSAWAAHPVG
eukprot:5077752-Pyramimonas_sp.AAC.1